MSNKKKQSFAIGINISLIIMEMVSLLLSYKNYGVSFLQFYTEESNIFALIVCIIFTIYNIKNYNKKEYKNPEWLLILKFASMMCLLVTFLVVLFILSNMSIYNSFWKMFAGTMFFHHFLCPVLVTISFIFFESNKNTSFKYINYSLIPTIIYGSIVLYLNIIKTMRGPYPFLYIYEQPVYMTIIWLLSIVLGIYIIGFLIIKTIKRINK